MSDRQILEIGIEEDGDVHKLSGIPEAAWKRFTENAKRQFPKHGEDAWAAYLSEVIVAVSGGDEEKVTYFMTDVPRSFADSLHRIFQQVGYTWDRFHAYLLNAASRDKAIRVIRFRPQEGEETQYGTFVVMGVPLPVFDKFEEAVEGKSFESIMATFFLAAEQGTLRFTPESQFAKAIETVAPAETKAP